MDEKEKKDKDKKDENSPENVPETDEKEAEKDTHADTPESSTGDSEPPESVSEESVQETPETESKPETLPDTSETDSLKAENLRLKAQIEAYKAGFRADVLEDAVLLASAVSERDGTDISAALQAVGEKYPDWKNGSAKQNNLRIGADTPKENTSDDSRFDEALGIRKRGK